LQQLDGISTTLTLLLTEELRDPIPTSSEEGKNAENIVQSTKTSSPQEQTTKGGELNNMPFTKEQQELVQRILMEKDYYVVLGLQRTFTEEQLKTNYKKVQYIEIVLDSVASSVLPSADDST
jgi:hypothetical protein